MANRYWVGGTGNWTSSSTTNWASSSGGTAGASVPTTVDDVFFDANSNTGTNPFTVTINSNINCRTLQVFGVDGLMTLAGASYIVSVYGSLYLQSGNVNVTFTGLFSFKAASGTYAITTNGNALPSIQIAAGTSTFIYLNDGITLNGNIYNNFDFVSGQFSFNGYTVNLTGVNVYNIYSAGSASRQLNFSNSTVNCYSTFYPVYLTGTNITASASSSTINLYGNSAIFDASPSISWGTINFQAPSAISTRRIQNVTTSSNISVLRIYTGAATGIYPFTIGNDTYIYNLQLLTSSSDPTIRHKFSSSTSGAQALIYSTSSFNLNYVDFQDISSVSFTWSGTSLGNFGNNTNITFPTAKTVYWNLAGTQNWSAVGWATSSGGAPALANFPLAQDTAIFDDSGAAGTVTVNAAYGVGTLQASARTLPLTINASSSLYLLRNLRLGSGLTSSGTLIFSGNLTAQITANGNTTNFLIIWERTPGSLGGLAGGDFTSTNSFYLYSGTFQTSGYNFTVSAFYTSGSGSKRFSPSSSTINITGSGFAFDVTGSNTLFSSNTATLLFSSASPKYCRSVTAFGFSNLIQNGAGALSMSGVLCTDISTNVTPTTVNFYGTNTFTNFNLNGTPGNLVTLGNANSVFGGNTYSLRAVIVTTSPSTLKTLNYVNVSGLQFETPINGVNTVSWYATNSTNSGNNQGIFFSGTSKKIFYIVGGTGFVLPNDWNPNNNRIFLVGGGGSGGQSQFSSSGGGGGGGGFTLVQNYAAPPGATVSYNIGSGGYFAAGGNTTWSSTGYTSHSAAGGGLAPYTTFPYNAGGTGGVGATFNGGNGGLGVAYNGSSGYTNGGGGGGGSGGPLGNGATGGNGFSSAFTTGGAGGGGGGNGGGSVGQNGTSFTGGAGGNNASGVGGGAAAFNYTNPGSAGGGASGSTQSFVVSTLIPSTGSDIAGSFGTGGGAGGGGYTTGNNAIYDFANSANGAGGGGGGFYFGSTYSPGQGGNGIIVVEYTPTTAFLMFMSAR